MFHFRLSSTKGVDLRKRNMGTGDQDRPAGSTGTCTTLVERCAEALEHDAGAFTRKLRAFVVDKM